MERRKVPSTGLGRKYEGTWQVIPQDNLLPYDRKDLKEGHRVPTGHYASKNRLRNLINYQNCHQRFEVAFLVPVGSFESFFFGDEEFNHISSFPVYYVLVRASWQHLHPLLQSKV